jgi:sugar phosphate isomerase/epimerase
MAGARLAAWLDSYRAGLQATLRLARRDGFRAVSANAAGPDWDPRGFSGSARRHLARYLRDLGLVLGEVVLAWPDRGLAEAEHVDARLERCTGSLEFAADLEVRRVGVTLGGFAEERTRGLAGELLSVVANQADRFGAEVTIYGGGEPMAATAAAIRALGCPDVRLGFDTLQLVDGPVSLEASADIAGGVVLRDARRVGQQIEEVPFGRGEIDFRRLLAVLAGHEHDRTLAIRRDSGRPEVDAMRQGREYMHMLMERVLAR